MQLLIVRHAEAEERMEKQTIAQDATRELTADGKKKMRQVAQALAQICDKPDVILTSPLVRAVDSAEILAKEFGKIKVMELKALIPGQKIETIFKNLVDINQDNITIVGHEPDLGRLIATALGCRDLKRFPLKKSAACLLEFDGPIHPGQATLVFSIPPKVLRSI